MTGIQKCLTFFAIFILKIMPKIKEHINNGFIFSKKIKKHKLCTSKFIWGNCSVFQHVKVKLTCFEGLKFHLNQLSC